MIRKIEPQSDIPFGAWLYCEIFGWACRNQSLVLSPEIRIRQGFTHFSTGEKNQAIRPNNQPAPLTPHPAVTTRRGSALSEGLKRDPPVARPPFAERVTGGTLGLLTLHTMTQQNFLALADAIRLHNMTSGSTFTESGRFNDKHIRMLADFCAAQDPRFNRQHWLDYIAGYASDLLYS